MDWVVKNDTQNIVQCPVSFRSMKLLSDIFITSRDRQIEIPFIDSLDQGSFRYLFLIHTHRSLAIGIVNNMKFQETEFEQFRFPFGRNDRKMFKSKRKLSIRLAQWRRSIMLSTQCVAHFVSFFSSSSSCFAVINCRINFKYTQCGLWRMRIVLVHGHVVMCV